MIGLLQRVSRGSVEVDGQVVGSIGAGLLVLVGIVAADGDVQARRLLERLLDYRVFPDDKGRMNRSLRDRRAAGEDAGLLLVPQFTLAADTDRGNRASFTPAAPPQRAQDLFAVLLEQAAVAWPGVQGGVFGADMRVALVNDGPVTFWLEA